MINKTKQKQQQQQQGRKKKLTSHGAWKLCVIKIVEFYNTQRKKKHISTGKMNTEHAASNRKREQNKRENNKILWDVSFAPGRKHCHVAKLSVVTGLIRKLTEDRRHKQLRIQQHKHGK
jgi:hypothetical protein